MMSNFLVISLDYRQFPTHSDDAIHEFFTQLSDYLKSSKVNIQRIYLVHRTFDGVEKAFLSKITAQLEAIRDICIRGNTWTALNIPNEITALVSRRSDPGEGQRLHALHQSLEGLFLSNSQNIILIHYGLAENSPEFIEQTGTIRYNVKYLKIDSFATEIPDIYTSIQPHDDSDPTLFVASIDFDGCYHSTNGTIPAKAIAKDIVDFVIMHPSVTNILVYVGSLRQSRYYDYFNANHLKKNNHDILVSCATLEKMIPFIQQALAEHCPWRGVSVALSPFMIGDVLHDFEIGTTAKALPKSGVYPPDALETPFIVQNRQNQPIDLSSQSHEWHEPSKISIFTSQSWHVRSFHKEPAHYRVYDDRMDILNTCHDHYTKNKHLIPPNITVSFGRMDGDFSTEIEYLSPIQGMGSPSIELDYRVLYKISRQLENGSDVTDVVLAFDQHYQEQLQKEELVGMSQRARNLLSSLLAPPPPPSAAFEEEGALESGIDQLNI